MQLHYLWFQFLVRTTPIFKIILNKAGSFGVWVSLIGIFSLFMVPVSKADECLKFANIPTVSKGFIHVPSNFVQAMAEAGICTEVVKLTLQRVIVELDNDRLDGVIMRVPAFQKMVGDSAVMIGEPVVKLSGMLISFNPSYTSIESLANRSIGIRRNAIWQENLVENHANVTKVGMIDHLVELFLRKRTDAILFSDVSAKVYEKELSGTTMVKVADLSGYPWLRSGLRHRIPEIVAAIRAFKAKGRNFLKSPPAN